MEPTHFVKLFSGNFFMVTKVKIALEAQNIFPIIKDEGESYHLAGFNSLKQGFQEIFVSSEKLENAKKILKQIESEL